MKDSDSSNFERCVEQIAEFSEGNLAAKVNRLEFEFERLGKAQIIERLISDSIDADLVLAARTIKRASAQIDVVLHALATLVLLPKILGEDEIVEALSLGAGSSEEKRFDLETTCRIAEFTFIEWKGNDNTRLQKVFKDFYRLAEFQSNKRKELWVNDDTQVLKFLRSNASVKSATHKHRDVWLEFSSKYPSMQKVADYYRANSEKVAVCVFDWYKN